MDGLEVEGVINAIYDPRASPREVRSADPFLPFYASFASERARPKLLWYYVVDTRWRDRIRRVVDDREQLVPVRQTRAEIIY